MAKYLKPDSEIGYIEEPTLIEYTKFNNLRHTILGFMMGDFDNNGKYYIDPIIVAQLISMRKHIIEVDENIEICHGELRLDKPFTFVITYEKDRVTLSILEKLNFEANYKLNSGAYSNINEFILDEIETSGIVDRNLVYKQWNVDTFGGREIDIFSCDDAVLEKYFGITNRFKYLLKANQILIDKESELEEIEAEYGNRLLELLALYPELKKIVDAQILNSIKDKRDFISIDKLFFAKTINEVIDKAIEENLGILSNEERAQFSKDRLNITRDTNIKREMVLDTKSITIEEGKVEDKLDPSRVTQIQTKGEEGTKSVAELAEELAAKEKSAIENRQAGSEINKFTSRIDEISGGLLIPKTVSATTDPTPAPANLVAKKADDLKKSNAVGNGARSGGGGGSGRSNNSKGTNNKKGPQQRAQAQQRQDSARNADSKNQAYVPYSVTPRRPNAGRDENTNSYDNIKKSKDAIVRLEKGYVSVEGIEANVNDTSI